MKDRTRNNQCASCNAGHFLSANGECTTYTGTCANGKLIGQRRRTRHNHCGSCHAGHFLNEACCHPFAGECINGQLFEQRLRRQHSHCWKCEYGYELTDSNACRALWTPGVFVPTLLAAFTGLWWVRLTGRLSRFEASTELGTALPDGVEFSLNGATVLMLVTTTVGLQLATTLVIGAVAFVGILARFTYGHFCRRLERKNQDLDIQKQAALERVALQKQRGKLESLRKTLAAAIGKKAAADEKDTARRGVRCAFFKRCVGAFQKAVGTDISLEAFEFEGKGAQCFCDDCHTQRGDGMVFRRGQPRADYVMPTGWARFGYKAGVAQALAHGFLKDFHVAYHGIRFESLGSILRTNQLAKPGDKVVAARGATAAKHITIRPGHIKDPFERKNKHTGKTEMFDPNIYFGTWQTDDLWMSRAGDIGSIGSI